MRSFWRRQSTDIVHFLTHSNNTVEKNMLEKNAFSLLVLLLASGLCFLLNKKKYRKKINGIIRHSTSNATIEMKPRLKRITSKFYVNMAHHWKFWLKWYCYWKIVYSAHKLLRLRMHGNIHIIHDNLLLSLINKIQF